MTDDTTHDPSGDASDGANEHAAGPADADGDGRASTCESDPTRRALTRRGLLRGVSAAGVAGGVAGLGAPAAGAGAGEAGFETSVDLQAASDPADYVDPFIGTARADSAGDLMKGYTWANCFPGPSRPHGMVQLSPDGGWHQGGYRYLEDHVLGFSHTHLSGAGCHGLSNILLTGTTGPVEIDANAGSGTEGRQSVVRHDGHFTPLQVKADDTAQAVYFPADGSGFSTLEFDFAPYQDGAWHHYAVTYEAGGEATVYVDGQAVASRSGVPSLAATDTPWALGADLDKADPTEHFLGDLDEVRVYDTALSKSQVTAAASGSPPSGALVAFPLDDIQSGEVTDTAGGDDPGTVVGGPSVVPGRTGDALSFDGVDDGVRVADRPALSPSGAVSASFWFRTSPRRPGYSSRIDKATETAETGYYAVDLTDYGVRAELTATDRVGVHRYTFPETDDAHVVIDASHNVTVGGQDLPEVPIRKFVVEEATVEVRDDRTVVGSQSVPYPFCGGREPYTIHFAARFSEPFADSGVWEGDTFDRSADAASGRDAGAVLDFATAAGDSVEVQVGISFVSPDKALANLRAEAAGRGFDEVRAATRAAWNDRLSRVRVSGGAEADKVKFYTAMYHAMLGPLTFGDADGEYVGYDDRVYTADDYTPMHVFSLWDTFRAQHPFLALLEPEVQRDAAKTLVSNYETGDWLPKWSVANRYANTMISDHASSVLAETITKGVAELDAEARRTAYEAMTKTATQSPRIDPDYTTVRTATNAARTTETIDLSGFTGDEEVRLRFADGAPASDGDGVTVHGVTVRADGAVTDEFLPRDLMEGVYLYDPEGTTSRGDRNTRSADGGGSWVYEFEVPDDAGSMAVDVDIAGSYEVGAASVNGTAFEGRTGLEGYLQYGYVPADGPVDQGVAKTIEDSYVDWCISQVAEELGRYDDARRYAERSTNWENVFDPETGFVRPRNADGSFVADFDPREWEGFTEGSSWSYTWSAQHDIERLVELLGRDEMTRKLDSFFSEIVFPVFKAPLANYWHGNEPGHHVPYLYNFLDQAYKTQEVVQRVFETEYTTTPGGVPGNDDLGQMSAWFAFSAMGLYPLAPADATYQLGVPLFDEVVIDLPDFHYDGATFTIRTEGPSHDPDRFRYVESATLNGEPLAEPELDHAAVADGGTLTLSTTTDRVRWGGGSPVDPVAGERPPTDPDRDGRFEDVDGDGRAGYDDVVTLFESLDGVDDRADADRFDFNGNGRIDHGDVVELFESI